MRVSRRTAAEAGGCNFCDRDVQVVLECRSDPESYATLVARVCYACARDLKAELARWT